MTMIKRLTATLACKIANSAEQRWMNSFKSGTDFVKVLSKRQI
jgi:hypothetical protein